MGELLASIPWQIYCTWSFRSPISPDGALREVRWWLGCLRFCYTGTRALGYMIGTEQEAGAAWCHAHGVVVALEDLAEELTLYKGKPHEKTVPFLEPFWLMWQRRHGGGYFALVKDRRGASFYCAKYAAKRGEVTFSSGLERFRGVPPAEPMTVLPVQQSLGGEGAFTSQRPPLAVDRWINRHGVVHGECHGENVRGGGGG